MVTCQPSWLVVHTRCWPSWMWTILAWRWWQGALLVDPPWGPNTKIQNEIELMMHNVYNTPIPSWTDEYWWYDGPTTKPGLHTSSTTIFYQIFWITDTYKNKDIQRVNIAIMLIVAYPYVYLSVNDYFLIIILSSTLLFLFLTSISEEMLLLPLDCKHWCNNIMQIIFHKTIWQLMGSLTSVTYDNKCTSNNAGVVPPHSVLNCKHANVNILLSLLLYLCHLKVQFTVCLFRC